MAISKILHMKDSKTSFHGKHLKASIDYIMNPEKTQNGVMVGSINCNVCDAFERMQQTKRQFGKMEGRQGYHLILSFKEDEVDPSVALEITRRFTDEYLGKSYEGVYVVHDNTEHIHSHIVFNSVSFYDGKKYRYEKGDWAKHIQPITNRLCQEYGLSIIDIEEDTRGRGREHYKEWSEFRDGKFVWNDMIKRDLDHCIMQAATFETFIELLEEKGYEVKYGKHIAVKPPGMARPRRCTTLGADYTEERIKERIVIEDLKMYQQEQLSQKPKIVKCYVKGYKKAKLSGLQKRYYAKLYRSGQLKKKPYSQVWKYKNDIRKMGQLQKQYLFLTRYNIQNAEELAVVVDQLTDKRKEASSNKSKSYKGRARCKELFHLLEEIKLLEPAENSFQKGDDFFVEEHNQWIELNGQLKVLGYTVKEVEDLQLHYKVQIKETCKREQEISKELNIGKAIVRDVGSDEDRGLLETKTKKEEEIKEMKQPRK